MATLKEFNVHHTEKGDEISLTGTIEIKTRLIISRTKALYLARLWPGLTE